MLALLFSLGFRWQEEERVAVIAKVGQSKGHWTWGHQSRSHSWFAECPWTVTRSPKAWVFLVCKRGVQFLALGLFPKTSMSWKTSIHFGAKHHKPLRMTVLLQCQVDGWSSRHAGTPKGWRGLKPAAEKQRHSTPPRGKRGSTKALHFLKSGLRSGEPHSRAALKVSYPAPRLAFLSSGLLARQNNFFFQKG